MKEEDSEDFVELATDFDKTNLEVDELEIGSLYEFTVQATNEHGTGLSSETLMI